MWNWFLKNLRRTCVCCGMDCLFLNQNILKPNRELEKLFNFCKNMGNFPIRYLPGIKLSYTDESV